MSWIFNLHICCFSRIRWNCDGRSFTVVVPLLSKRTSSQLVASGGEKKSYCLLKRF